jgi:hypothetical protein
MTLKEKNRAIWKKWLADHRINQAYYNVLTNGEKGDKKTFCEIGRDGQGIAEPQGY